VLGRSTIEKKSGKDSNNSNLLTVIVCTSHKVGIDNRAPLKKRHASGTVGT
jgi:hypothetical protein